MQESKECKKEHYKDGIKSKERRMEERKMKKKGKWKKGRIASKKEGKGQKDERIKEKGRR